MRRDEILSVQGRDYSQMTVRLLTSADLAGMIGDRNARICLKPNLVVAGKASNGGVTHPEIVDGVITYLKDNGFENITLMEGSWVGDDTYRAFRVSGIGDVCKMHKVPYYNTKDDSYTEIRVDGHSFKVTERLKNVDWLINLPVLKGHCQTLMTCALKNHKGLLSDPEKRRFHREGLHEPIAYLAKAVTKTVNEFIVIDNICGDHDFEEGGNPVYTGRILCSLDPVLTDAYACSFLGYENSDVPYVEIAQDIGVGEGDISGLVIRDIDMKEKVKENKASGKAMQIASYIEADNACSACYANLVAAVARLKEEGLLDDFDQKIKIGQGFRKKYCEGIGVGNCTVGCTHNCPGCPPTSADMYDMLKSIV